MRSFLITPARCIKGKVFLPGDKSIAHRSVILSSLSNGKTILKNFPVNKDCLRTIKAFKILGIKTEPRVLKISGGSFTLTVYGRGLYGLSRPISPIFAGDSGTTFRLLLGVLAGQDFKTKLTAAKSLSYRPMLRVTRPLRKMGAIIKSKIKYQKSKLEEYPPITISAAKLKPVTYKMPVASAQVKSAILLAGLYAKGKTRLIEPIKTRDHTERMLKLFKADLRLNKNEIVIRGGRQLVSPGKLFIPGDISSASFFMVMASIVPNSQILIRGIGLNPTRTGIIKVLKRMGAQIRVSKPQSLKASKFEPLGDLAVKSSSLRGTKIKKEEIPSLIDELPVLMVAASVARGRTIFEGVNELRVKETDRIRAMSQSLKKMGADIRVVKKGNLESIVIRGVKGLQGARVKSFGDHRTAMSMVVAGLKAGSRTVIDDITCINKSFPGFLAFCKNLSK